MSSIAVRISQIKAFGAAAGSATSQVAEAIPILESAQATFGSSVGGIRKAAFSAEASARQIVAAAITVAPLADPRIVALAKLLDEIAPAVPLDLFVATVAGYISDLLAAVAAGSIGIAQGLLQLRRALTGLDASSNLIAGTAGTGARGSEAGLGMVVGDQLAAYKAIRDFAYGLTGGI